MSLAVKQARYVATGDPGLFGSIGKFLGGVARVATGVVGTILPGPVGFAARLASKALGAGGQPQAVAPYQPPVSFAGGRPAAFGRGGVPAQITGATAAVPVGPAMACPPGMRANKSAYFLRDGSFVPKNSRCVAIRRRNPGNSRANDRAIGRIESAKKMAARLGRITIRSACPHK
jgi:hypothetical protein